MNDDGALFHPAGPTDTGALPFAAPARLTDVMAPDWAAALAPVQDHVHHLARTLEAEQHDGAHLLPGPDHILRAFTYPMSHVKVLIVGQDPYPTPGHAVGLSFSVSPQTKLPRSLVNIYKELAADLDAQAPAQGDLSGWAEEGVLLLNRVLTVRAGETGSHRRIGWEAVTDAAVRALTERHQPLVAILWGREAQQLKPLLGSTPLIESAHPSPLSAARGFFGSRPFSRANALLQAQGAAPVNWLRT
ncbi:uracil-DNA glycosylase [Arthrobacter pigmenti]|uniref:Uracil-DNA glycosylase n=1 Tax=Arthrobacter pigmenti TaxID=271432 RepID=A0A846RLX1_9MICC|nr:uracil-DNA glycosylase [Arthrobacter pigmenti]NJC21294.1 uracil-DNA glycosylase [Arthrobacter pigmenti]